MRTLPFALALCLPLFAAGSVVSSASADEGACAAMPDGAATSIPSPLGKWAQVVCTPQGQVITGHDKWVWYDPEEHAFVAISSRISEAEPASAGAENVSYFTKIQATRTTGDDFEKAYQAYHVGFDPRDGKPAGYRLDVTTMNGKSMSMYVFDYITYGWAIMCKDGECNTSSRFLILNTDEELKPLPPSI